MEHPLDAIFNAFTAFVLPWLILVFVLVKLKGRTLATKLAASSLFFLAATTFFTLGTFGWIMRDGMGPDAVTSKGTMAIERFFDGFWPILLFSIACAMAGKFSCRRVNPSEV